MSKIKITHIIVGLNVGGAETMLFKLLKNADRTKFDFEVISLMDEGTYGPKIRKLGIPVHTLGMKRGIINPVSLLKAKFLVKDANIIQTWMYHADLFGYIIKKRFSRQMLIWGIRHSNLEKNRNKKLLLKIAKLNSFLSKNVDLIISCSKNAVTAHKVFGYRTDNMITIPNGFELDKFYKHSNANISIKKELCLPQEKPLFVHVGRWDSQKDYPNLIKAISLVQQKQSDINFILCGAGIDKNNEELINLLKECNVKSNLSLLGKREDIPSILSAADALISSSSGEGFSNVIGEAMACETPCIVTDVGDSAYIVGKTGIVVPPQNPQILAEEILNFVNKNEEEKVVMGGEARDRIVKVFEIKSVVKKFEEQYMRLLDENNR